MVGQQELSTIKGDNMTPASKRIEEMRNGNRFDRIVYHTFNYGLMAFMAFTVIGLPLTVLYYVIRG
jgi:hypothetical protein